MYFFLKALAIFIATLSILLISSLHVIASEPLKNQLMVNDGPYVFIERNEVTVDWVCNSKRYSLNNINQGKAETCDLPIAIAKTAHQSSISEQDVVSYNTTENIAAMSDFHGQYDLMFTILTANKIIDEQGNWMYGKGHFVITGDVFDRGDKVTEILWFLYRLEKQAELAGGKVHLLLGNHEVMVLNGDLRYLHEKYHKVAAIYQRPFDELFSKNTLLGQWLRSKPVLVKINNMLFAHGGFHPELAQQKHSLTEINQVFKANLVKKELVKERQGFGKYLHKRNGPIWYRGYFNDDGATSQEIDFLLKHFAIDYLVVGHTSQTEVQTRYNGRVIAIDTSIKNGQYGEVLLVEERKLYRGTPSGDHFAIK